MHRLLAPGTRIVGVGMKMHLGLREAEAYLRGVAALEVPDDVALFVLPSFPVLPIARELLAGTSVAWGAQDVHWEDAGPHTGSVSARMLAELGCVLAEVGHAERRRDFGEDDAMTAAKAAAAVRHGIVPVACVGEGERGTDAEAAVAGQVRAVCAPLAADAPLIVAYEPVWAIGAPEPAGAEHVARVVAAIRSAAGARSGPTRVLYGGAVDAGSAVAFADTGIDGLFTSRTGLDLAGLRRLVAG